MNFQNNLPNTEATGKISVKEVIAETLKVVKENKETGDILDEILGHITSINFKKEAQIGEKGRVTQKEQIVITVDKTIEIAKQINFGLCKHNEGIYAFNNQYWEHVEVDRFKNFLGKCAEKLGVHTIDSKYFKFKDTLFEQFLSEGFSLKPMIRNERILINLNNGTFEITPEKQELRDFNADDFITYQLQFDFNPHAKCPLFMTYLNKVLPNMESQMVLAEFIASVFIRRKTLKLEKALMLYGSGANGKSVFFEIINALLGEENVANFQLDSLTDDKGQNRAKFADKLLNYSSEISNKVHPDRLKQLVSGEPVEARRLYGDPFTITDYPKLAINCNELPTVTEHTEGYFRRFLIISFDVHIPEHEQDKELANKIIESELSGVFNWILEGLQRILNNRRYTSCKKSEEALDRYRLEADNVGIFLDENGYERQPELHESIKSLYNEYSSFCYSAGYHPVNKGNFKKRLISKRILVKRHSEGDVAYITKDSNKELPF